MCRFWQCSCWNVYSKVSLRQISKDLLESVLVKPCFTEAGLKLRKMKLWLALPEQQLRLSCVVFAAWCLLGRKLHLAVGDWPSGCVLMVTWPSWWWLLKKRVWGHIFVNDWPKKLEVDSVALNGTYTLMRYNEKKKKTGLIQLLNSNTGCLITARPLVVFLFFFFFP